MHVLDQINVILALILTDVASSAFHSHSVMAAQNNTAQKNSVFFFYYFGALNLIENVSRDARQSLK